MLRLRLCGCFLWYCALGIGLGLASVSMGGVVINEIVTGASEKLLRWDRNGLPHLGTGPAWYEPSYSSAAWGRGPGPFGFGYGGLGTEVADEMRTSTPSLYVRRRFFVDAETAAGGGNLALQINYDDGFVAFLNGREIARSNLGNPHTVVYRDQPAFNKRTAITNEWVPVPASTAQLQAGENILAIQVHNTWPIADLFPFDGTLYLAARLVLEIEPILELVEAEDEWEYFVGLVEPSGGHYDAGLLGALPDLVEFSDWVELHNTGETDVSLTYWSLTDDEAEPQRWIFPSLTIPAGGYLVVFCSGWDRRNPSAGALHTNFKLNRQGEYLGLFSFDGGVVSELARAYPSQDPFHSYGLDPVSGRYVFFETPTPGRANSGVTSEAVVEKPLLSPPAGFYEETGVAVRLECPTWGATIRYTLDGSEPTESRGAIYSGPIWLGTSTVLRAAAYRAGWIVSPVGTATYLLRQPAALRTLPALTITGRPEWAIYKPDGVTAIEGGHYVDGVGWQPLSSDDYNMALMYGRPFERPVSLEFLAPEGPGRQIDAGLRLAASRWSRPRMTMEDLEDTIWNNSWPNKPSFSFFFRDDYGGTLEWPVLPEVVMSQFDSLRLRAGKNDWANPFIRDEVVRRLFVQMGQITSQGILCNLFINGRFKGYFNLVERMREPFFQFYYDSTNRWDVRHVDEMLEGDAARWTEDAAFIRTHSLADPLLFAEAMDRFDLTNIVDYLLLNIYTAMWDWPRNNFYLARERTEAGRWRFAVWDAEGSFGLYTGRLVSYNTITNDLQPPLPYSSSPYHTIPVLFDSLRKNPEFRLLFADRIQKHMFQEGALTEPRVSSDYIRLKAELEPVLGYVRGEQVQFSYFTNWVRLRAFYVLEQCREAGLWPETLAPQFDRPGGVIEPGTEIVLMNPNPTGTIYFTMDGADPRLPGGDPAGQVYAGPVLIEGGVVLKARVLDGTEWSPLASACYTPPRPGSLVITEIHYEPLASTNYAGSRMEFVEIQNLDDEPAYLDGVGLVEGVQFDFPCGTVLAPGAFAVVAADLEAFQSRYPGVSVTGVFTGKLDNDGERLSLAYCETNLLFTTRYNNVLPWPILAAGAGHSLVPCISSASFPDDPAYWRASYAAGGSPGSADPEPDAPALVISEILAHPHPGEWWQVELHNPSAAAVDLGGWCLSPDPAGPDQVCFVSGITIPANGYLIVDPPQLAAWGIPSEVRLSPSGGVLTLLSGDAQGNRTGYAHAVSYGPVSAGVSLGRFVDSLDQEHFVTQTIPTLGEPNAGPQVGPVIFNEIAYEPAGGNFEFVELANVSPDPVPLFHADYPSWTWSLEGIDFRFPTNLVLAPGEFLLIVSVAPDVFRAQNNVPAEVTVLGPYPGHLDNGGERLRLLFPEQIHAEEGWLTLNVTLDEVRYDNQPPWPETAAGHGDSLQRLRPVLFGDDPSQWQAGRPTPGRANVLRPQPGPEAILSLAQESRIVPLGLPVQLFGSVAEVSEPVSHMLFLVNQDVAGTDLEPPFDMSWVPAEAGSYDLRSVARFDTSLSLTSGPVHVQVVPALATNLTLVPAQASWRYLDTGLDLGSDWIAPRYQDASWADGPAQLGYGEGDEATVVGYGPDPGNKYLTTYFRHAFLNLSPPVGEVFLLNLLQDDGAVVYLNGAELLRNNMPQGPVDYLTPASREIRPENVFETFQLPVSLLESGSNQLAVEVHQSDPLSDDLSFALELIAPQLLLGPWIIEQPADSTALAGSAATLSVATVGNPLSIQWFREGGHPLPNATSAELVLDPVDPSQAGGYFVVLSNSMGSAVSRVAQLDVVVVDTDEDGLPDYWELRHGLDPNRSGDAQEDPDQDGLSNREEFDRQTHPMRVDLVLAILSVPEAGSSGAVVIEFRAEAGRDYRIESAALLESNRWETFTNLGGPSEDRWEQIEIPIEESQQFYRVWREP